MECFPISLCKTCYQKEDDEPTTDNSQNKITISQLGQDTRNVIRISNTPPTSPKVKKNFALPITTPPKSPKQKVYDEYW